MMKREWLQALLTLTLLWAVSLLWVGQGVERRLEQSAAAWVAEWNDRLGGGRLSRVEVDFEGQQAILKGRVRSAEDARRLRVGIAEELKGGREGWGNPVTNVRVDPAFAVVPQPCGWLLFGAVGVDAVARGVCATEAEKQVLEQLLRSRWSVPTGRLEIQLTVDTHRFDETAALERSLDRLGVAAKRGTGAVRCWMGCLGRSLESVDLSGGAEQVEALAMACGVGAAEWRRSGVPLMDRLRDALKAERFWEEEQLALAGLPPAHAFVAVKGNQILLRGEVFGVDERRSLIAAVMAAYPGRKILDDVRTTQQRRPGVFFGGALPMISESNATGLLLGQSGREWLAVDWQGDRQAINHAGELLPDLTGEMLLADRAVSIDWLEGDHAGIPQLALPLRPAFLTLALYAGRVVLGGEVAEEAERSQAMAAVRRAYPGGWVLLNQVRTSSGVAAGGPLIETLNSFPPAPAEGVLVAIARVGDAWRSLPAVAVLGEPGGVRSLAEAGELTEGSADRVAEALRSPMEEMRAMGIVAGMPTERERRD